MKKVSTTPRKCLVLTTREYILRQAEQHYERVSSHNFDPTLCVVNLSDYTPLIRAQILYNHVSYSSLDAERRALFATKSNYEGILAHPNFNPRLIALSLQLSDTEAGLNPIESMLENFRYPRRIWQHIVDYDLNDNDVALLELLFAFGTPEPSGSLETAWESYARANALDGSARAFRASLRVLENTMIRIIHGDTDESVITFHDPSVTDYVKSRVLADREPCVG